MGVFVWLVLPCSEAANLGVFDLCHFALLKRGCANSVVGLELAEIYRSATWWLPECPQRVLQGCFWSAFGHCKSSPRSTSGALRAKWSKAIFSEDSSGRFGLGTHPHSCRWLPGLQSQMLLAERANQKLGVQSQKSIAVASGFAIATGNRNLLVKTNGNRLLRGALAFTIIIAQKRVRTRFWWTAGSVPKPQCIYPADANYHISSSSDWGIKFSKATCAIP